MNVSSAESTPIVVAGNPQLAALKRFEKLSGREYEVAVRIAQGMRQAQISNELGISPKTVQTHREHALVRLCVRSNSEVAILAFQAGLVACP